MPLARRPRLRGCRGGNSRDLRGDLTQITTGLSDADQFLQPEAIAAAERLARRSRQGADPHRTTAPVPDVLARVTAVPGVESASQEPVPGPSGWSRPSRPRRPVAIAHARASWTSEPPWTICRRPMSVAPRRPRWTSRCHQSRPPRDHPADPALVLLALRFAPALAGCPGDPGRHRRDDVSVQSRISWLLFTQVFGFARSGRGACRCSPSSSGRAGCRLQISSS